ncbi:MAG TPA: hypothetical protein VFT53_05735 [Candidatus Saccharimonadales bacterium]|nr:hypothetical protein [Candidatus Saccharimonadales bacterium]
MAQLINETIDINAFYFTSGKELKSFPRQMEYGGEAVTFTNGLCCRIERAGRSCRFFDMSGADGLSYRLREEGNQWTLVSRA